MDFNDWYDCVEEGFNRQYLYELSQLILPGAKLSKKDCEQFWALFKAAQKDAFESGRENK